MKPFWSYGTDSSLPLRQVDAIPALHRCLVRGAQGYENLNVARRDIPLPGRVYGDVCYRAHNFVLAVFIVPEDARKGAGNERMMRDACFIEARTGLGIRYYEVRSYALLKSLPGLIASLSADVLHSLIMSIVEGIEGGGQQAAIHTGRQWTKAAAEKRIRIHKGCKNAIRVEIEPTLEEFAAVETSLEDEAWRYRLGLLPGYGLPVSIIGRDASSSQEEAFQLACDARLRLYQERFGAGSKRKSAAA